MNRRFIGGMIGGAGLMILAISGSGGKTNDAGAFFGLLAAIAGLRLFVIDPKPAVLPPPNPAPPPIRLKPEISAMDRAQALALLGLREPFSATELRAAYSAKMFQYHPDRVAGLAPEIVEISERETKRLNAAFELLSQK